ncbi:UNVERIFIED_ORG: hypothetical protein ABRZ91_001808 [Heyndrickxia coagulans]
MFINIDFHRQWFGILSRSLSKIVDLFFHGEGLKTAAADKLSSAVFQQFWFGYMGLEQMFFNVIFILSHQTDRNRAQRIRKPASARPLRLKSS